MTEDFYYREYEKVRFAESEGLSEADTCIQIIKDAEKRGAHAALDTAIFVASSYGGTVPDWLLILRNEWGTK